MTAKNDITGDAIKTKSASSAFRENYDRIFKKKSTSDFQDILSTEECIEAAFDRLEEFENKHENN
jgi:hypothetical protein